MIIPKLTDDNIDIEQNGQKRFPWEPPEYKIIR